MTKKKTEAEKVKKKAVEPEFIYSATLDVAQIFKQGVRMNVKPLQGVITMTVSNLFFSRDLLPPDYEIREGREYSLVVTRVK
jgi:hypothetical protein